MAWPYEKEVLTSFRYTSGYQLPPVYDGDAKLTQISSFVNDTTYEVIYRCQNCFKWDNGGAEVQVASSEKSFVIGRAQAIAGPKNPGCPEKITFGFHDNGYGQFGAALDNVTHASYSSWAALATKTVKTTCEPTAPAGNGTAPPSPTGTAPTRTCPSVPTGAKAQTYEYIVVGGGAGGIPIADRLSEAGHKVLLIEKGPPSSGRWGGTMKPEWLDNTNLTRFDVPGLCNQIWHDSTGIACTDTDQMAGCVLGGGTAVNAGLWWKVGSYPFHFSSPPPLLDPLLYNNLTAA